MNKPIHAFLKAHRPAPGADGEEVFASANWRLTRDVEGVAWLALDRAGKSANTIDAGVLEELAIVLGIMETDRPKGLVIRSGKTSGFAVGADVAGFVGAYDPEAVQAEMRRAHKVIDRLEAFEAPTVALIHGFCLGGGLELALACDHRIAAPDARLGFPEVNLGLHPGLGGTFRLTGLIDPVEAMTMMLTGRDADARRALNLGLVDEITEQRHFEAAARNAVNGGLERQSAGLKALALSTGPVRRIAADRMRDQAKARARRAHYPAPYALIRLWDHHGDDPKAMQRAEIASFAELMTGPTAQNLIRVFFLREQLKRNADDASGIRHVHVVGAGTMGGDIAAWCALKGLRVSLADQDHAKLAAAIGRASKLFTEKLKSRPDRRDARDRLIADFEGAGIGRADLVIEAIGESVTAKTGLYAALAPRMKPGAILATNTSSLPLETLAKGLDAPERFVGLHFFNPVAKMTLVEVVSHDAASEGTLRAARTFARRIDRLPAPVKSAPGFLVNRILTPYLIETLLLIDEGVAPETVDAAAEAFGMAMGPAEMADRVGLDICLSVGDALRERLDTPLPDAPDWLRERVAEGRLGVKTGGGIYEYDEDGKPKKKHGAPEPGAHMTDRLILPMVNAAAACLREGVVADADTLDAAMIFATGFAPFRGGPARYARDRGATEIKAALSALETAHGPRFHPDRGLGRLSEAG